MNQNDPLWPGPFEPGITQIDLERRQATLAEQRGWGVREYDGPTFAIKLREPAEILSAEFLIWYSRQSIDAYAAKVLQAAALQLLADQEKIAELKLTLDMAKTDG